MIVKYKFKIVLFIIFFLLSYNIYAYELRDAIKDAINYNKELYALKEELAISGLAKPKAATEFLPDVSIEWKKIRNNSNDEEKSKLKFKQELYAGGRSIAKIAAADAKIAAADNIYKEKVNDIIYDVISAYHNIMTIRGQIRFMKNDLVMAQKNLERANIGVRLGAYNKSEIFYAKSYLSEQQVVLEDYQRQLAIKESHFEYHTGKKLPEDCKSVKLKKYEEYIDKYQDIQSLAVLSNKSNKAKNELEESKQNINISASEVLPKANFFASVGDIEEKVKKKYGIEVSIPIFNAVNYINISNSKKNKELKEYQLKDVVKSIINDLNNALVKYKATKNILNMHKISEEYNYKTLLSAREELSMGSINISQIIEIQKEYNKSAINRLKKEEIYSLSIFEIYKIIGDLTAI